MKPRPELLPPDALVSVATVFAHGAEVHGARAWEAGRPAWRDYGAALRHLLAHWRGETIDPHSGEPHLAHAAARILILLAAHLRRLPGHEDRA